MVKPTQQELATLAVALPSGSSSERVNAAYAIWRAASQKLKELNETDEEKHHRERDELMDYDDESNPIGLSVFLRRLMDRKSIEVRNQQWKKFLMHRFRNDKEVVDEVMRRNEADGIDDAKNQERAFLAWRAANTKQSNINRAKKGGYAKSLKENAKK